jgi:hypothetical protein
VERYDFYNDATFPYREKTSGAVRKIIWGES